MQYVFHLLQSSFVLTFYIHMTCKYDLVIFDISIPSVNDLTKVLSVHKVAENFYSQLLERINVQESKKNQYSLVQIR